MALKVRQIELRQANEFVGIHHRHHKPVQGHRFSIAAENERGELVGVCIVGRPVARKIDQSKVVEVTRLCTDGTRNACSFLYGAAARAAKSLGYKFIQTYTLPQEGGGSLVASGWVLEGEAGGGQWKHTDGKPRRTDQPTDKKYRWKRALS